MKPTNSPTQGQPNPRKKQAKSGNWAIFPHSKVFFVGWDWFYIGNRLQKPNPTKFSATTLMINSDFLGNGE